MRVAQPLSRVGWGSLIILMLHRPVLFGVLYVLVGQRY
jgi:hypothetical protein